MNNQLTKRQIAIAKCETQSFLIHGTVMPWTCKYYDEYGTVTNYRKAEFRRMVINTEKHGWVYLAIFGDQDDSIVDMTSLESGDVFSAIVYKYCSPTNHFFDHKVWKSTGTKPLQLASEYKQDVIQQHRTKAALAAATPLGLAVGATGSVPVLINNNDIANIIIKNSAEPYKLCRNDLSAYLP